MRIRELVTEKETVLDRYDWTVWSVDFSPDGQYLAIAGGIWGNFGKTEIWEVNSGQPRRVASLPNADRLSAKRS